MKKEIPFHEGKVVFFKEANFWGEVLDQCKKETKAIFIATYNFNFQSKYEKTFYRELSKLADLGIDISLLYSKMTYSEKDKLEVEEIFKNFVLCAELVSNHSKLFIADDFAFIGSANFSFGSNNNYECGVIFTDKKIISEIRKYYCEELLDKSEFTNVPEVSDPFDFFPMILKAVEKLGNVKSKEELSNNTENFIIGDLRFIDDIERYVEILGYPVPSEFDWWPIYMSIHDGTQISETIYQDFMSYIRVIHPYLIQVSNYVKEQYESIGRNELMKKIGILKD
ncbi:phospholipase D-like domain-containing protein [Paenibacillus agricola]|uniref:NgoFVII family restriction endonuclease n=1 Tax=Paenibacillus agricola TaxID=2716264 RepID=A0ABX0JD02_9BACL|nr:phospholipase D-like domain-containing protein [Paenibacillus agricola]NHN33124.1 NgoFVII family restriction endonuclease [Paenibacillus agricola]